MSFESIVLTSVVAILLGMTAVQTAILDPMTAMRDDVSRIKVMMESVGGICIRFKDFRRSDKNRILRLY